MKKFITQKAFEKIINGFYDLSILKKMILSFVFVIIVPLFASYYISQKTSSDIIVKQVCGDTSSSIELKLQPSGVY